MHKSVPGDPDWVEEEASEPVHASKGHRKMCKDAGGFFEKLSREKAFGDPHRAEAKGWHKVLDEMVNPPSEEAPEDKDIDVGDAAAEATYEPGEMGEKELKAIFETQNNAMKELNRKRAALNGRR